MMRRAIRGLLVSVVTVASVTAVGGTSAVSAADGPYQRPGTVERVSVASNGAQSKSNPAEIGYYQQSSDLSQDGRLVMFTSVAANLVPNDTNLNADVFLRDRVAKVTKRVSVTSDGAQAIGSSEGHSMSANGRHVAFRSTAVNLVPGDTNLTWDAFVHDTRTRRTVRVSVNSSGAQANHGDMSDPAISANGRYVAFSSQATNLVPGDTNNASDVFVHDLKTGKTVLASVASNGARANGESAYSSLSADGRYVVFQSRASNLVTGDTNGVSDVFRHDLKTGRTVLVSVGSDGAGASFAGIPSCEIGATPLITLPPPSPIEQIGGGGGVIELCRSRVYPRTSHAISADGRYVTFTSTATNLVPNDSNFASGGGWDSFVHDVWTGRTERVSVDSYGHEDEDQHSESTAISATGRYVVSDALASPECPPLGILPPPVDGVGVCLPSGGWVGEVHDRLAGASEPLAVSVNGKRPKSGPCSRLEHLLGVNTSITYGGAITPDGRYVSLASSGQDLVAGDTNKYCDIFVRDRGPQAGVGNFGGAGMGSSPGPLCVIDDVCVPPLDVLASRDAVDVRTPGADLIWARVVHRPAFGDLFVGLDVEQMPAVTGAPVGGLLYGLRFTAGGERYEVRAQRVPGADFDAKGGASFGLFRQDRVTGVFTKVASLKGGYGTTGPSVVFAIPVKELAGGRLSDVRAFTGVGSYLGGVAKVLDAVRLGR